METIKTHETEVLLNIFISFLQTIGIETVYAPIEEQTFLPGLKIAGGKIIIDKNKLLYPGDLLHEAGHIAVAEASRRMALDGNVTGGLKENEGEELAAMLWSYAACVELKISPEIVFHKDGYKGASEWLIDNYKNKTFIGLPLLVWMGMTTDKMDGTGFPVMTRWIRS